MLLNTAVATRPTRCAWRAPSRLAIEAGRVAYEAGLMPVRDMAAAVDAGGRHAVLRPGAATWYAAGS